MKRPRNIYITPCVIAVNIKLNWRARQCSFKFHYIIGKWSIRSMNSEFPFSAHRTEFLPVDQEHLLLNGRELLSDLATVCRHCWWEETLLREGLHGRSAGTEQSSCPDSSSARAPSSLEATLLFTRWLGLPCGRLSRSILSQCPRGLLSILPKYAAQPGRERSALLPWMLRVTARSGSGLAGSSSWQRGP